MIEMIELMMLAGLALWSSIDLLERASGVQVNKERTLVFKYTYGVFVALVLAVVVGIGVCWISRTWYAGVVTSMIYLILLFVLSGFYTFRPFSSAESIGRLRYWLAYIAPVVVGAELLIFIRRAIHPG